jgi:hypothetical protein
MKEIYAIDPSSDLLDPLIVRSISIEEESFLPPRYAEVSRSSSGNLNSDSSKYNDPFGIIPDKLNSELCKFTFTVAKNENTNKPYLWNLAAGYLSIVINNYKQADVFLAKALNQASNDTLVNEQIRLFKIVSAIEQIKKPDEKFEKSIVLELKWLNDKKRAKVLKNKDVYD